ncbi:MAG: DUF4835 family protein [Bacteroidia bacterium]|nr:DUF4835 family protein [Bacteroidia bacterium]
MLKSIKIGLLGLGAGLFMSSVPLLAQEIECQVVIDSEQLITQQTAERAIFDDLQKAISNFINNNKWTDDNFGKGEQIKCYLEITLRESPTQNVFQGNAQLRASRPIYNTTYESNLITFIDQDFQFRYVQGQPLIFNINSFSDNLTSMLAFYVYVVLAMDYDSFAQDGGNPYVEQAFNIVNVAQGASEPGWRRSQSTTNRFWLIENLNSQQMIPFREAIYKYHRQGLDTFLLDAAKSRQVILDVIKTIQAVNRLKPSAVFTNIFFDSKHQELFSIFKEAPAEMRQEVRDMLVTLDPGHTARYDELLKINNSGK